MELTQKTKLGLIIISISLVVGIFQFLWLTFGPCRNKTDLVFMIDDSGSIKDADFEKTKNFVSSIVQSEDISVSKKSVNVALCKFSNDAQWIGGEMDHYIQHHAANTDTTDSY